MQTSEMPNVSSETKIHWVRLTKNRKLQRKKISKLENSNINIRKQLKMIIVTYRIIISDLIYLQLEPKKKGFEKNLKKFDI